MRRKSEFDYSRDAKVLLVDTENSPNKGWFFGAYDVTPVKVEQPPLLLAISWKWLGDSGSAHGKTLFDFPQEDRLDDSGIVKKLWELLNEASIVVAHNVRFDCGMANTYFLRQELSPPSPYKMFDTLGTARRFFHFDNNKLDNLGRFLFGEGKTEVTYKNCWDKMLNGDKKEAKRYAKLMNDYCKNDVDLLEKIYLKLRPWACNHPNMALASGHESVCPRCGRAEGFILSKYRYTGAQINAIQFQCRSCGAYVTRRLEKEEREELEAQGKLKSTFRNLAP